MFVDVPIKVHVPPTMDTNESGMSIFDGLILYCLQMESVIGRKTATAAVLLIKADTIPTVVIKTIKRIDSLLRPTRVIRCVTRFMAPVFTSPPLKTNMAAMVAVAVLLKPEIPSLGVGKLLLKSPMRINVAITRIATKSTRNFSEAKRTKVTTMIEDTRMISVIRKRFCKSPVGT